jgi:hypothetical protein
MAIPTVGGYFDFSFELNIPAKHTNLLHNIPFVVTHHQIIAENMLAHCQMNVLA